MKPWLPWLGQPVSRSWEEEMRQFREQPVGWPLLFEITGLSCVGAWVFNLLATL